MDTGVLNLPWWCRKARRGRSSAIRIAVPVGFGLYFVAHQILLGDRIGSRFVWVALIWTASVE